MKFSQILVDVKEYKASGKFDGRYELAVMKEIVGMEANEIFEIMKVLEMEYGIPKPESVKSCRATVRRVIRDLEEYYELDDHMEAYLKNGTPLPEKYNYPLAERRRMEKQGLF